jgi:hypothetical protein
LHLKARTSRPYLRKSSGNVVGIFSPVRFPVLRRVSLGLALALAALTTVACSNPTEPTAKSIKRSADVVSVDSVQTSRIAVQGSSI